MDLGDETNEMMLLEYAGEAQLYVPVSQLHFNQPLLPVRRMRTLPCTSSVAARGTRRSAKPPKSTRHRRRSCSTYAQRAAQSGHKFEINEMDYQAFADGFGYEETEDQAAAIAAVIQRFNTGEGRWTASCAAMSVSANRSRPARRVCGGDG